MFFLKLRVKLKLLNRNVVNPKHYSNSINSEKHTWIKAVAKKVLLLESRRVGEREVEKEQRIEIPSNKAGLK